MNRRFLTWGVFLVTVGAIPLAVRGGLLSGDQVATWWNLWPLVVVGIGVGLVLSRTPLEVLGGLLVAVSFGAMAGAFLATGAGNLPGAVCGNDRGGSPLAEERGSFDGPAEVTIELDCGEVELTGAPGGEWSFGGDGDADHRPTVRGSGTGLEVRSAEGGVAMPFVSRREHWEIGIPTDVPIGLDLQLNAGRATIQPGAATLRDVEVQVNFGAVVIDLGEATAIGELDLQSNAGSSSVTLPATSMSGRVQVNAGSVRLCAPPEAALRLRTGESVVGSYDFARAGLVQDGNTWTSPGFDTAEVRIDLSTEANAGSVSLNPEEGCDD